MPKSPFRALAVLLALFGSVGASAGTGDALGLSPFAEWKTLVTPHFRITFPQELSDPAELVAGYLEEAQATLSPMLLWTPKVPTEILIVDNVDAANGLASPVDRFGIVLQITPPEDWFSIGYYEDWLRMLAIHEYTHILNLDVTRGVWEGLRIVFGDLFLPNSLWPRWMTEGLAVYNETRYTRAGRGRSPFYQMVIRAAVDSGKLDDPEFVTLDRLSGTPPIYPGGEIAYLFGYELMQELASDPLEHLDPFGEDSRLTADGQDSLRPGDLALGQMSYRSGNRFPFLINSNLENITGQDWRHYWNRWLKRARQASSADLARIQSQPLTRFETLTSSGYETLGVAASRNGRWLAYNEDSLDRGRGLMLRDLSPGGETRRLFEKSLGVGLAFTPSSDALVFSALRRHSLYATFSELGVYDLANGQVTWLSDGLRARDPDVSPDGNTLVFTLTRDQTVGLYSAALVREGQRFRLGEIKNLYTGDRYSRISGPKFSPDGRRVAFAIKVNGAEGIELRELDIESGEQITWVADGKQNRHPAYSAEGELFFVSDATGADNVYQLTLDRPKRITNFKTGTWLPTFGPKGELYASVFSYRGWELARLYPDGSEFRNEWLSLSPPNAPERLGASPREPLAFNSEEYSPWPSLFPRQWAPILLLTESQFYAGGQILGHDSVDLHEYSLGLAYDSETRYVDWAGRYSNRLLGVTLSLFGSNETSVLADSTRVTDLTVGASAYYPFLWTASSLVPALVFQGERETFRSARGVLLTSSRLFYTLDGFLSYSDVEASRLAIAPERGRSTVAGVRGYIGGRADRWKGLLSHVEHLPLPSHWVLDVSGRGTVTSRKTAYVSSSDAVVSGKKEGVFDAFTSDLLDELPLRGYPGKYFYSRAAAVASLDLLFPFARIHRGIGTHPIFFKDLHGFVFAESAFLSDRDALPAIGAGARLDASLLNILPMVASLEWHQGTSGDNGGRGEFVFQLGIGGLAR